MTVDSGTTAPLCLAVRVYSSPVASKAFLTLVWNVCKWYKNGGYTNENCFEALVKTQSNPDTALVFITATCGGKLGNFCSQMLWPLSGVAVYREGAMSVFACVSNMNDVGNTHSVLAYLHFSNTFFATSH